MKELIISFVVYDSVASVLWLDTQILKLQQWNKKSDFNVNVGKIIVIS